MRTVCMQLSLLAKCVCSSKLPCAGGWPDEAYCPWSKGLLSGLELLTGCWCSELLPLEAC